MRKNTLCLLAAAIVLIGAALPAVLAEEQEVLNPPVWFRLLEPIGVLIGVVGLIISYSNLKKFGGVLGKSYAYFMAAICCAIVVFVFHGLFEGQILRETLLTETVFEIFLYGTVIFLAIAAHIAGKGFVMDSEK